MNDKKYIITLEMENDLLKRKLQKAAELNHQMWLCLQEQVIHTEQLEEISGIRGHDTWQS